MKYFVLILIISCFYITCIAQESFVSQRNKNSPDTVQQRRDLRKINAIENNEKNLINTNYAIVPTILGILSIFLLIRAVLSLNKVLRRKNILHSLYEEEKKYFKIIKLSKYLSNQKSEDKQNELANLLKDKQNELKTLTKLTNRKKITYFK
ncbi:MAG: hypothetical protein HOJ35_03440 [Bdellovibrionales bacterium]|nr:hypothetical protein [Bdellovibrionales bacterium]